MFVRCPHGAERSAVFHLMSCCYGVDVRRALECAIPDLERSR